MLVAVAIACWQRRDVWLCGGVVARVGSATTVATRLEPQSHDLTECMNPAYVLSSIRDRRSSMQVHLEGSGPFVVQAVVHDMRQRCPAAAFLHTNLFPQIDKTARSGGGLRSSGSVSPLYSALIKLTHAFAKEYPKVPAKEAQAAFLQTDCSIAVLDIERGRLYTLCFGRHSHVSHVSGVVNHQGHALEAVSVREHTVRKTSVFEATYDNFQGQQYVVLGSPGLWCAPPLLTLSLTCPDQHCSIRVVPSVLSATQRL